MSASDVHSHDRTMQISTIAAHQLDEQQVDNWRNLQNGSPHLQNPFFSPEFTQAVAQVRDDIEVAVFQQRDQVRGFLPFQRCPRGVGRPVAHLISELHGVIGDADLVLEKDLLLKSCQLAAWRFSSVPATQQPLSPFFLRTAEFPYIDLRSGFDEYVKQRRSDGSNTITQVKRKARKMEREIGKLRLEVHTTDDVAFQSFLKWKSRQYAMLGTMDYVNIPWISQLLHILLADSSKNFSGMFSVLYANESPVACHLGMRSASTLAWCFPSYDEQYQRYSPGLIMLTWLLEQLPDLGVDRVDLGQGAERYKSSFQTNTFSVGEGALESSAMSLFMLRAWIQTREWVSTSRIAETPLRTYRRIKNAMRNGA